MKIKEIGELCNGIADGSINVFTSSSGTLKEINSSMVTK